MPSLPARMELIVAVWLVTVIVGAVPVVVSSVSVLPVRNQLLVGEELSPNFRFPIVRAALRVTVWSAKIFKVLKSAVKSVPSATMLPDQLPTVLQVPLENRVHVPLALAARAICADERRRNADKEINEVRNSWRRPAVEGLEFIALTILYPRETVLVRFQ